MDTMKPNQVCVCDSFVLSIQTFHPSISIYVRTHTHTSEELKVKQTLMQVVLLPPSFPAFCQAGDTPLHLAARNGHLDAIHMLLLHFDTRDEVNTVGNQHKHLLQLGVLSG